MKAIVLISATLAICLTNCTTKTEVYESQLNREFANGQTIFVKKTDEYSRTFGAVTGRLWNEQHSFKYKFTIEPKEIIWEGLMGETPKHILNCTDGLYLKTTTVHVQTDTVTQETKTLNSWNYYHHIDKRYLFNMLGDQYFVLIDSSIYQTKRTICTEENVPNM